MHSHLASQDSLNFGQKNSTNAFFTNGEAAPYGLKKVQVHLSPALYIYIYTFLPGPFCTRTYRTYRTHTHIIAAAEAATKNMYWQSGFNHKSCECISASASVPFNLPAICEAWKCLKKRREEKVCIYVCIVWWARKKKSHTSFYSAYLEFAIIFFFFLIFSLLSLVSHSQNKLRKHIPAQISRISVFLYFFILYFSADVPRGIQMIHILMSLLIVFNPQSWIWWCVFFSFFL